MIHPAADVSPNARIGEGTTVWNHAQVRENACIGKECRIGKGVYIDHGVSIGDRVKIQNNVSVYHGATIEDGVFVGPHVTFTNDRYPRAIRPDGTTRHEEDWTIVPTLVREGASIGAGAVIVCGVTIGRWAMVAAGAVVTRDVPEQGLVAGNPAAMMGWVCTCGHRLERIDATWHCRECGLTFELDGESPV
ncbi:MAG TPA: acyltransferase [Dehalococcoidia bacterium]